MRTSDSFEYTPVSASLLQKKKHHLYVEFTMCRNDNSRRVALRL
jgi:hypothetical protein